MPKTNMERCKHLNYCLTEEFHGYSSFTFRDGQWINDAIAEHTDSVPSGLIIFECDDCGFKREYRKHLPKYIAKRWEQLQEFQHRKYAKETR